MRLAVEGEPIICHPISDLWEFIENNLVIVPTGANLTTIKYSWLKEKFRELPPDASLVEVLRYTRAYLLFLISVTIFADPSVATVPTRYLQFFEYIKEAGRYAWGAAALTFLYRSLGGKFNFFIAISIII
ncbi:hypothetical protein AMTR_s00118p00077190 [Amborella trichopoda]|uniref:Aminotransferase-like plant mobile domain-containing protein n=1 Tax=Amborella trichopoda TaxID=13333 RepID=W1NSP0_AMBTC|nr:hypothetical protein AMTR_s00118p00077190 [Amborella trichopoda]